MSMPVSFSSARILVAGDVMLDRYWFGDVSRISPEAPVPVVRVERCEERLGGAANVARNLAALSAQPTLLGVVGMDEGGNRLLEMVDRQRIGGCLYRDPAVSTVVKLRVIGRQQQLLRIDFERPPSEAILRDKLTRFHALLPQCDVAILSDYAKGALVNAPEMIAAARRAGKPLLVDPKGDDFSRYRGASVLTPNKAELRQIVGAWRNEDDLAARVRQLCADLEVEALLLTRSEEGMSLYRREEVMHFATQAREVYDVSGAGDTVIAALAAALGAGMSLPEAVTLANRAAGIVVGKLGTSVVTAEELFEQEDC